MKTRAAAADPITLQFADAGAWEAWLMANAAHPGLWLKIAKKGSGVASVSYAEAVEVALCHGWIDGQKRSHDAAFYLQRFTPRRPKSVWSKINIAKVDQLIKDGRMREAGMREVLAAKADGRWERAYDGARTMQVPEELAQALAASPAAEAAFAKLNASGRYAFCWRVQTAKKAETRIARAQRFVLMLERGEVADLWPTKPAT